MKTFALVLFLAFISPTWAIESLPARVAQSLKGAGIPPSNVAIVVQEAGAKRPWLQHHGEVAMNPASVMKLVTTYAGLDILGPAYSWQTGIYTTVPLVDGVLNGDLYLKGSGDPRLTFEQFWLLLRQLRSAGLREIKGRLVLDRSAFTLTPTDANTVVNGGGAPFDDQPLRPYNVKPDALLLNWKSVRLQLSINGDKLQIQPEPQPANLYLISQVTLTEGECGDWRSRLRADVSTHPDRFHLVITGSYPRSCGAQTWHVGVLDHPQYVYGVFRQLWEELGGSISGGVADGRVPPQATQLAGMDSPPLSELIRDINKFSNNVMARQLYLSLGDGSTGGADKAVRAWLERKSLRFPELVLENGSGLSRNERISASSLAALLNSAWQSPWMPEYVASMPIIGVDGTMKKRLRDGSAYAQGHVKTGTLDGVKTIAGYVRDRKGKWQIVVFLINHPNAAAGQAAQDALLAWLTEQ
ncbi:MAG TPA: D-alanyl-D-alanine carboxypeptidase/D-alanyl-D-alanine-endopeptidase [Rhodocyclaceae bacterium]|jgi:D-alanyl-D-alanine carboxypeptidase/D-alanyl-D-alanine-endopeptidase (penicillin-binding protein 4)|nr:D-alanyl-D-alanine carboxypeptidase/D-alanyl-D-alanine-endopeptidase [Rhodocyclaceae bacterium]